MGLSGGVGMLKSKMRIDLEKGPFSFCSLDT